MAADGRWTPVTTELGKMLLAVGFRGDGGTCTWYVHVYCFMH